MALWRFDLCFLPDSLRETSAAVMQTDALDQLVQGLNTATSIAGWRVYGGEVGHRVEVRLWSGGECEVIARLDARAGDTDRFIREVCMAAQTLRCRLFSVDLGEVLDADPEQVKEALRRSTAWRSTISSRPTLH